MHGISIVLALAAGSVRMVTAQTYPATPLASKHFAYPTGLPYQADTEPHLVRGGQTGYNICNSTTQNQDSLCQTAFVNSIDGGFLLPFLRASLPLPPPLPSLLPVGANQTQLHRRRRRRRDGRVVHEAWARHAAHPRDTLQGVQFMRTPDYIQVVGYIAQSRINLKDDDYGGEMDPHGADLRGNPSAASSIPTPGPAAKTNTHNFLGTRFFCIKACDPSKANAARYCEHIFDRIGTFPGVYVDAAGATQTYKQPPESLGPITAIPYTARVPASSNCVTHTSSAIYAALLTVTAPGDPTATPSAFESLGECDWLGRGEADGECGGVDGGGVWAALLVLVDQVHGSKGDKRTLSDLAFSFDVSFLFFLTGSVPTGLFYLLAGTVVASH
ncbi:putative macrofage activating glycoprotein [Lyophyllum shimeji]|uniref:Macrofage activating glycoprotein n=1 Tax=Lyophyllum shimeji TaxID=47721 RepID=A0A9P3PYV4_LYOSH|nr:putative macrofage activating glycoprotein [Lyophyllum shimeji]